MGKETVLALLLREKGHFVSGEAVSAELGITRAAIWKSISALRAQGYEIDAVTGRGYCLKSLPDTLTEQTVRSYLGPVETVGKRIDCFDSIDSTNAYLKRIALDGAPEVEEGGSRVLTVTPEDGYRLARLTVNGLERTADENGRLALEGILEDLTIEVTFEKADGNDALYYIMIAVIVLIFAAVGYFFYQKRR